MQIIIKENLPILREVPTQVGEDIDRKKRPRTAFTAAQIKALEAEFERNKWAKNLYPSKNINWRYSQWKLSLCQVFVGEQENAAFQAATFDRNPGALTFNNALINIMYLNGIETFQN